MELLGESGGRNTPSLLIRKGQFVSFIAGKSKNNIIFECFSELEIKLCRWTQIHLGLGDMLAPFFYRQLLGYSFYIHVIYECQQEGYFLQADS